MSVTPSLSQKMRVRRTVPGVSNSRDGTLGPFIRHYTDQKSGTMKMNALHLPTNGVRYRVGKRLLDLILAIAILPVVLVLVAIVAIIVKASSPGPIFYRHQRVGLGEKTFGLWKFRTMLYDSDHIFWNHLAQSAEARREWLCYRKRKHDPRITKIGAFLRRTNLDELPQLLNVILGQMSLVGPRPIVEEELKRYGAGETLYAAVLPG